MRIFSIFLVIFITGCGFKTVDPSESNFQILGTTTSGDKRIGFKIKNKLLTNSNPNSKEIISIDLNTVKQRSIREKNIKNEVTKYVISVTANVTINFLNGNKQVKFNKMRSGVYDANDQYSQTLNNEKKTLETLTKKISEDIISEIILTLNAV